MQNVSSEQPQPAQNNLFSSKNLLLLLLFSLILVILTASTTYFLLQSKQSAQTSTQPTLLPTQPIISPTSPPDEMANRKTYINNQYKFSFKYPYYWSLTDKFNIK